MLSQAIGVVVTLISVFRLIFSHNTFIDHKRNRKPNRTENQLQLLVKFVVRHPERVSGNYTPNSTIKGRQNLWGHISSTLNDDVGSKLSWSEWRKVCIKHYIS